MAPPADADMARTPTGVRLVATRAQLAAYLDDDLGEPPHDVTSDPLFGPKDHGTARLVAREACVVAGIDEAVRLFEMADIACTVHVDDGTQAQAGATLLTATGPTPGLLRIERTALNIVGRMSGIATLTRRVQEQVAKANPDCRVAATRKTTPGFRVCEKRAVWLGGGDPHRYGLFDQVLVKDNHRAAVPDLERLIKTLRDAAPKVPFEVEVETLAEALLAARLGVDWILIDNQTPETLALIAAAVRERAPEVRIEASGGITEANVARYAPYVDRVSMGALTQAAVAIDVGLDWELPVDEPSPATAA